MRSDDPEFGYYWMLKLFYENGKVHLFDRTMSETGSFPAATDEDLKKGLSQVDRRFRHRLVAGKIPHLTMIDAIMSHPGTVLNVVLPLNQEDPPKKYCLCMNYRGGVMFYFQNDERGAFITNVSIDESWATHKTKEQFRLDPESRLLARLADESGNGLVLPGWVYWKEVTE